MSNYIGNQPAFGEFKKLDSIVSLFNGSTTQFNLEYNSVGHTIGDATQLIVSLNGVVQEPGTAYTLGIGGGSVVFASAPASTDTCHIVSLGGVGGTTTPTDGSVTASKLDSNLKDYLEETFTADGTQTVFTLTRAAIGSNSLLLSVDGIVQPSTAYSVAGTTLTISPALPNTTNVRVVHLGVQSGVYIPAADSITSNQLATLNGNLNFDDNAKAVFGEGSDLQIYHDGSHSYISDQGTGNIKYRAASRHQFENADGSKLYMQHVGDIVGQEYVQLRYNNVTKLATTSTGIDVTGQVDVNSVARIDSSGIVKSASGTEASPSHSFLNDPDNGMFRVTTNTIGFSTAGSEAMRIDSTGNLLINKTSADGTGSIGHDIRATGLAYHTVDGGDVKVLNRLNSDGGILSFRKDGATIGSIGNNTDFYIASQDGCGLRFTNNQVLPCSESGATQTTSRDLGSSGARFRDLYLAGGVVFDAVSGNATSNTLDDYEEGSWTPTLGAASANPTVGYNAQVGHYTKIGNLVTVSCRIVTNSRSGGSGHLLVRGLPFTVATAEAYASATIGFNYNWNTPPQHAGAQANTVTVLLYQDGRTNAVSGSGDIAASGSSYLNLTCSYITNA